MSTKYLILGASSEVVIKFILRHEWNETDEIFAQYFRHKNDLEELQKKIPAKMKLFKVDFQSETETENFADILKAENFVPTHILHAPAVPIENKRFTDFDWKNFENQINVQCRSLTIILNRLIKSMSKAKFGKIILILSSVSINIPPKYLSAYVTAKYALMGLGKSLAAEYAPKNIQVNMISPSMMDTKFLKNLHELTVQQSAEANPMKRSSSPEEVANLIEFLFSDSNSFITGANIPITGGEVF